MTLSRIAWPLRALLSASWIFGLLPSTANVMAQTPSSSTVVTTSQSQPLNQTQAILDPVLTDLLDRVWDDEIASSPMLATDVGDPRGQDRLADVSLKATQERTERTRSFLAELDAIDAAKLSEMKQIDAELLRRKLENRISDFDFQTHLMPISNREGFHISFPEMTRLMNPQSKEDFANYVSRLRAFDKYVDSHIALMRQGIEQGLTQPAIIMRDSADQAAAHAVDDPARSLLMTNINEQTKKRFSEQDWSKIEANVLDAIATSVAPAYRRFAEFLRTEYIPASRTSIAAAALPQGREFYRDRIERFTTLALSPAEVHAIGVRENERIRGEMEAIRVKVNFQGDLPAFVEHLRTDPKFYAKTPEELLEKAALILKRADGRLPELFGHLPRIPYGLKEIPLYVAPQTSSAYYWPPSSDGRRAGVFYLNTYNLKSRPIYQLESLSMHEAVPGHHLQIALQTELEDVHPMSRQSNITAFIEGWGLYSERLGKEIGFYSDPYQDFGRLSMEAWRASRLVVDTGIHWMGWSRQQAIQYMSDHTALSEHNIVAEVDRYIGWPGQALAYKIGELSLTRLRKECEDQLGDRFDVRAFHDHVLAVGSIPLPLLERRVHQWLQEQLQSATES
ncbi:Uncharacterized conserved protein, DUF885 familyt [Neorhodopirellula lusitana]|uniref:Uncharacterized conserved protein, DUF885 familyt n=1 Tax=Neorhodopirellula lusitana TaxID=445327 RepID=A0ABY1PSY7_9BACT|nr:DUF885 domain-containing protein [Neorhodopirellula lusitana]SMP42138.1 Uncharacterized conserved protein, DUF885 familyt [Neorhodopirellula lusitana]